MATEIRKTLKFDRNEDTISRNVWGAHTYKAPDQGSSKLSRSSKTRKIWKTFSLEEP